MTNRAYALLGFLCVLFIFMVSDAHAQQSVTCTLDASAALSMLFGMPAQEVLGQAFGIGLFTPLTGYFVAYFVGLFVNFWNERG